MTYMFHTWVFLTSMSERLGHNRYLFPVSINYRPDVRFSVASVS